MKPRILVELTAGAALGDLNADRTVDGADLGILRLAWGAVFVRLDYGVFPLGLLIDRDMLRMARFGGQWR